MKGKMNLYYDEKADYLEIFAGESRPNYGEDVAKGITVFKDEGTNEVVGLGVIGFRKRAQSLKEIEIDLPFDVNFSAI
jgi:hypothetical protein